jgi:hypothetical protein
MLDEALAQQLVVISALTEGRNSTDAAAQAGVHRNTIAHWRRNSLLLRESLAGAQYDRALPFREKAEDLLDLAFETLHTPLTAPHTSPSEAPFEKHDFAKRTHLTFSLWVQCRL